MTINMDIDLELNGGWVSAVDSGDGVRSSTASVDISNGRSNWSSRVDTAHASFTVDNQDGRWSPRNTAGPHFGDLRRNIGCRVGVKDGDSYLDYTGLSQDLASAPADGGAFDITDDLDARMLIKFHEDPNDITSTGLRTRLAHFNGGFGGDGGWEWEIYRYNGQLHMLVIWETGASAQSAANTIDSGSYLPFTGFHDEIAVRVTVDASAGDVTFYHSDAIDGTWTQVGTVVNDPAVAIGTPGSPTRLRVGGSPNDSSHTPFPGKILAFELRDGIDGTLLADPDFRTQTVGASSFDDGEGNTWTIGVGGRISNTQWRFHGELSSLPVRWDTQGRDQTVRMEAAGIFRRLRSGRNRILESPLRRGIVRSGTNMVGYWPCEESGETLTRFGAAIGDAAIAVAGEVSAAAYSGFEASDPIPTVTTGVMSVTPDTYTENDWQIRWLQFIPADFVAASDVRVLEITTTVHTWELLYRDAGGGSFTLRNTTGGYTSPVTDFEAEGEAFRMTLSVEADGSNVDAVLLGQNQDEAVAGGFTDEDAVTSTTPGRVTGITFNPDGVLTDWAIGGITLQSAVSASSELSDELNGHSGEKAADRIRRLCTEEGIPSRVIGDPADTEEMGPQKSGALIEILEECAASDLGLLFEPKEVRAVGFRTRRSMVQQTPRLSVDHSNDLGGSLQPDDDDQGFVNDVEVENWDGQISRSTLDDGSVLSVSEPPTGIGRYDGRYPVSLNNSEDLPWLSDLILARTTVDEPRISSLPIGMHRPQLSAATKALFHDLDLGDEIEVTNAPSGVFGSSTTLQHLVQGFKERLTDSRWDISYLTTPGSPWSVEEATRPSDGGGGGGSTDPIELVGQREEEFAQPNDYRTSWPIDLPADSAITGGYLDGDLIEIILFVQEGSSPGEYTGVTSGWTERYSWPDAFLTQRPMPTKVYKYADGTEDGDTVTFTFASNTRIYGRVRVWRNVDSAVPYDVAHSGAVYGSTDIDPASVTTVTNNAVVTTDMGGNADAGISVTSLPSGYTAVYSTAPSLKGVIDAYMTKATAGAENPGAYDVSMNNATVITDALRPAAGSGSSSGGSFREIPSANLIIDMDIEDSSTYGKDRGGQNDQLVIAGNRFNDNQDDDIGPGSAAAAGLTYGYNLSWSAGGTEIHSFAMDGGSDTLRWGKRTVNGRPGLVAQVVYEKGHGYTYQSGAVNTSVGASGEDTDRLYFDGSRCQRRTASATPGALVTVGPSATDVVVGFGFDVEPWMQENVYTTGPYEIHAPDTSPIGYSSPIYWQFLNGQLILAQRGSGVELDYGVSSNPGGTIIYAYDLPADGTRVGIACHFRIDPLEQGDGCLADVRLGVNGGAMSQVLNYTTAYGYRFEDSDGQNGNFYHQDLQTYRFHSATPGPTENHEGNTASGDIIRIVHRTSSVNMDGAGGEDIDSMVEHVRFRMNR